MRSPLPALLCCFFLSSCTPAPQSIPVDSPPPAQSSLVLPKPPHSAPVPPPPPSVPLPGCPPVISLEDAEKDFSEAQQLIRKAGEHPSDADLNQILPRLKRAALSGHLNAQARYGHYVVGYWLTDEIFWPQDKTNAVSALAMLRVAVRRNHPTALHGWPGLGSSPPVTNSEPLKSIPKQWLAAAVAEADDWERCHPQ